VLGLSELVSILERRAALLRDSPAGDPGRSALQGLVDWSYDLLQGNEKTLLQQLAVHRGGASLASLAAVASPHGLNEGAVAHLVAALVDKSIVAASFSGGAARYDMLDTVRAYVLDRLYESGGLEAARKAHAEYFAAMADAAKSGLRRPEWLECMQRLERERDNLWAALGYARDAPDPVIGARLGVGLGWYFGLAERVSDGRAFIETALGPAEDIPLPLRIELLAYLCYLATEEDDLEAAIAAGEGGLALAAASDAPWPAAMIKLALAFAYDRAGPPERAVALADEARREFGVLGDRWGTGSSALTGAVGALVRGDIPTAEALVAEAARLHDEYDVGAVPAALLEASLAERRGDTEAAAAAYRRALDRYERAGFADHASFALTGLGSIALARGDRREAEELQEQALAMAEAAHARWVAAHARVQLARMAAAAGDAATADRLYRQVVESSRIEQPHQAREGLFLALAGSPRTAAELALAELDASALA